jgi:hypothetical protein
MNDQPDEYQVEHFLLTRARDIFRHLNEEYYLVKFWATNTTGSHRMRAIRASALHLRTSPWCGLTVADTQYELEFKLPCAFASLSCFYSLSSTSSRYR